MIQGGMEMAKHDDGRGNYFQKRAGTEDARFHVVPGDEKKWAVKKRRRRRSCLYNR